MTVMLTAQKKKNPERNFKCSCHLIPSSVSNILHRAEAAGAAVGAGAAVAAAARLTPHHSPRVHVRDLVALSQKNTPDFEAQLLQHPASFEGMEKKGREVQSCGFWGHHPEGGGSQSNGFGWLFVPITV